MRGLLFIFLLMSQTMFGQITFVPDSNFEQSLINLGYDNAIDGIVLTSNINSIDTLIISNKFIESIVGIEDFYSLSYFDCSNNLLDSIDVSSNYFVTFNCSGNQLTEIDISNSTNLLNFKCNFNNLSNIDISSNTSLLYFECIENQLTQLDLSNNISLNEVRCNNNQLTSVDVGGLDMYVLVCDNNLLPTIDNLNDNISLKHLSCSNNSISNLQLSSLNQLNWLSCYNNQLTQLDISNQPLLNSFFCRDNPSLNCINVNDVAVANANWQVWNGQSGSIDPHHYFSTNCNPSSVNDIHLDTKVVGVLNMEGRKTNIKNNTPLIYMYSNGAYKKIITLE